MNDHWSYYMHKLQREGIIFSWVQIIVKQVRSSHNLTDLFTKPFFSYINFWESSLKYQSLPTEWSQLLQWWEGVNMKDFKQYHHQGELRNALFFLNHGFSHRVFLVRFLTRQYQIAYSKNMMHILNQWTFKGECYEEYMWWMSITQCNSILFIAPFIYSFMCSFMYLFMYVIMLESYEIVPHL